MPVRLTLHPVLFLRLAASCWNLVRVFADSVIEAEERLDRGVVEARGGVAVATEAKGEAAVPEESFETVVDLNLDAYIPDRYIPNEFQKVGSYAFMLDKCGLSAPKIAAKVADELKSFDA